MLKVSLSSLFKLFTSLLKLGIKKKDSKRKKKLQENKKKIKKKMVVMLLNQKEEARLYGFWFSIPWGVLGLCCD